ncbi:MAG: hypothetical protein IJK89_04865 [Clostridia bacterium]|nr:hypothetical protein [Clostridia bacterium]
MCIELRGTKVRLGFAAAAVAACLMNTVSPALLAAGALGVLIHELTHLLLMRYFGCRHSRVEILPGGVKIVSAEFETLGYRQASICLLGAPAVNLLLSAVFSAAKASYGYEWMRDAAAGNLLLGAVNLLPMPFLDGGRSLEYLLSCRISVQAARSAVRKTGAVCLLLMAAYSVFLFLTGHCPVGFLLFFGYCLAAQLSGMAKK